MLTLIVLLWLGWQCWQHTKSGTHQLKRSQDAYQHAMGLEAPEERQAQLAHYVVYSGQARLDAVCVHIFLAAIAVVIALGWHDIEAAVRASLP